MEPAFCLSEEKRGRLQGSWAEVFRTKALPLINEDVFADMYCANNGRPNVSVQILVGFLILKEMRNLTDREALERLEFDLTWHHALQLTPDEAHLPQKTVHNFRVRLMEHEKVKLAFRMITQGVIEELGTRTERQRVDSTHITSNFAVLTRLGLFCETARVFLKALSKSHPGLLELVPVSLRRRYLKDSGDATSYQDSRSSDSRRRLSVCARDIYRLLIRFQDSPASEMEAYALLERLFSEQCELDRDAGDPGDEDDDSGEGRVPVRVKDSRQIASDTLQTPHDPDVTYSGHKGKGYEAQICETSHEDNDVEIITEVRITASSGSDAHETIPTLEALESCALSPETLLADTSYGSADNAVAAERMGTELVSPVAGSSPAGDTPLSGEAAEIGRAFTDADFIVDLTGEANAICPQGNEAVHQEQISARRVRLTFCADACDNCEMFRRCLPRPDGKAMNYSVDVDTHAANLERRRRDEAAGTFRPRYAPRAGIEATNSELKRAHGFGRLRIRGGSRVDLAAHLKAAACNLKRMISAITDRRKAESLPEAT